MTARLRVLKLQIKRAYAQYVEEQRALHELQRKKKRKKEEDVESPVDGHADSKHGGAFDAETFATEFRALVNELTVTVHPDTLRIDLHPVYVNFVRLNAKGHFTEDAMQEVSISRYATLSELYMLLCASCGYLVEDMEAERARYRAYLEFKVAT